jgi:phosphoadenosine phosphosulfate reductase
LVVLDLVRQVVPDVPVVFFDSGLEYPETYSYIKHLAHSWDLDLYRIPAEPSLLDALVESGQWDHDAPDSPERIDLHEILIGGPSRQAHSRLGPGELWGVRADESAGRRALYASTGRKDGVVTRANGTVAYGPIWDWSDNDVWAYLGRCDLPVNPVYRKLAGLGVPESAQRVSHLLDGDHLERGRLTWLRRGWPALFEQLADALPRVRQLV